MRVLTLMLSFLVGFCSCANVDFSTIKCQQHAAPANGKLVCYTGTAKHTVECEVKCYPGFELNYLPAAKYTCDATGQWVIYPKGFNAGRSDIWPDCHKYKPGEPVP